MSDGEDLQANPFFQGFLSSEYSKECAKNQLIVCVPSTASVKLSKINKDFIQCHVLKVSPYFTNEYMTLNGKSVAIKGNKVFATQGFSPQRIVSVLFEELYYDDNFESFKVLRINFPLVGKVPPEYAKQIMEQGTPTGFERRTIQEHFTGIDRIIATFSADPKADTLNCVTAPIQKFVNNFNNSYVMVKGFINHTANKVRESCTRIRVDTFNKIKGKKEVNKSVAGEFQLAVECIVLSSIHKKVFTGLCELHTQEDQLLSGRLLEIQRSPPTPVEVGLAEDIQFSTASAVRIMATLNSCVTPLQKLCCLEEVTQSLTSSAESKSKEKDMVLSADDIIPMMVLVVIHSHTPDMRWKANVEYLQHFFSASSKEGDVDLNMSHLSVYLANLQGVIQYVESGRIGADGGSPRTEAPPSDEQADPVASMKALRGGSGGIGSGSGSSRRLSGSSGSQGLFDSSDFADTGESKQSISLSASGGFGSLAAVRARQTKSPPLTQQLSSLSLSDPSDTSARAPVEVKRIPSRDTSRTNSRPSSSDRHRISELSSRDSSGGVEPSSFSGAQSVPGARRNSGKPVVPAGGRLTSPPLGSASGGATDVRSRLFAGFSSEKASKGPASMSMTAGTGPAGGGGSSTFAPLHSFGPRTSGAPSVIGLNWKRETDSGARDVVDDEDEDDAEQFGDFLAKLKKTDGVVVSGNRNKF